MKVLQFLRSNNHAVALLTVVMSYELFFDSLHFLPIYIFFIRDLLSVEILFDIRSIFTPWSVESVLNSNRYTILWFFHFSSYDKCNIFSISSSFWRLCWSFFNLNPLLFLFFFVFLRLEFLLRIILFRILFRFIFRIGIITIWKVF